MHSGPLPLVVGFYLFIFGIIFIILIVCHLLIVWQGFVWFPVKWRLTGLSQSLHGGCSLRAKSQRRRSYWEKRQRWTTSWLRRSSLKNTHLYAPLGRICGPRTHVSVQKVNTAFLLVVRTDRREKSSLWENQCPCPGEDTKHQKHNYDCVSGVVSHWMHRLRSPVLY